MISLSLIFIGFLLLALVITAIVVVGMIMLTNAADRDTVSAAREGWIHRRSEKDTEEE